MYNGLTKIFWGIFIATFSINLPPIKILPEFVGFIVISSGINSIYNLYNADEFRKALDFSRILIAISLLGGLVNLFTQETYEYYLVLQLWPVVFMTIELVMFYYLFAGFESYLNEIGEGEIAKGLVENSRIYIIIFIIDLMIISFVQVLNISGLNTICAIVLIILRVSLMLNFGALRKILEPKKIDEEII